MMSVGRIGLRRSALCVNSFRSFGSTLAKFQAQKVAIPTTIDGETIVKRIRKPVTVDRDLPDPYAYKKQNRYYFVAYGIGVIVSCAMIFNYEKTTSPIITSTMYFLRRSEIAKRELGDGINYLSSWPWISGELNQVKGRIDIEFNIKGSIKDGKIKLKATRESKLDPFNFEHFLLVCDTPNGPVTYDLRKDPEYIFDL